MARNSIRSLVSKCSVPEPHDPTSYLREICVKDESDRKNGWKAQRHDFFGAETQQIKRRDPI